MTNSRRSILVLGIFFSVFVCLTGGVRAADRPAELYQTASQQFWNGNYTQSLKTYRRIVENHPDHDLYWDAQFGVARSLFESGKMTPAAAVFRKVQRNHPEKNVRGDALFSLVEIAVLQDKIIKARNLLRTFLDVYDNHPIHPTAKKQLSLLERTPTAEPASVEPSEGSTGSPGSDRPPRLKSAGEKKRPEALPTTGSADEDTRPVTPPPIRDRSDTPSVGEPGVSTSEDQDTASESAGRTSVSKDTAPSNRISPVALSDDSPGTEAREPQSGASGSSREAATDTAPGSSSGENRSDTANGDRSRGGVDRTTSASPSAETLRKRMRNRLKEGESSSAYRAARKLIDREDARPEDFYRAAQLSHRQNNPASTSLKFLNKATALSSTTPGRHLLLKAELLLSDGQRERVSSLLATYFSDYYDNAGDQKKARYHFLRAKLHEARKQDDEAFFQYMSVLQTAPKSRWGQQAQTTLDNKY